MNGAWQKYLGGKRRARPGATQTALQRIVATCHRIGRTSEKLQIMSSSSEVADRAPLARCPQIALISRTLAFLPFSCRAANLISSAAGSKKESSSHGEVRPHSNDCDLLGSPSGVPPDRIPEGEQGRSTSQFNELLPSLGNSRPFPLSSCVQALKSPSSLHKIYGEKELLSAQLDLLSNTNMVDFAMDIHRKLHETEPPATFATKRAAVLARLKELNALCAPLVRLLQDQAKVAELKEEKNYNIEFIQENLGVRQFASSICAHQFDCNHQHAWACHKLIMIFSIGARWLLGSSL